MAYRSGIAFLFEDLLPVCDRSTTEADFARISSPLIVPKEGLNKEFADHMPGHAACRSEEAPSEPGIKRQTFITRSLAQQRNCHGV